MSVDDILERAGVRPTANRVLVFKALQAARSPMSLIELETALETLERSSVLRALTVFADNDIVHLLEDGRGVTKYELCHSHDHSSLNDQHPHFYCEKCQRVYCFDSEAVPPVNMPAGFSARSVNYMIKGICPHCGG